MKTVSRIAAASALAFVISLSAFAGDMHTTITDPPPDSGASTQTAQTNTAASQPTTTTTTPADPVTGAILAVLPTLLSSL
jgi:uncharacterized protein (DUF2345 family)